MSRAWYCREIAGAAALAAVLVAAAPFAATAWGADHVQLRTNPGDGFAAVAVQTANVTDADSTEGLTFSGNTSADDPPESGHATQESSITDDAGGITFSGHSSLAITTDDILHRASSGWQRVFDVSASIPYEVRGTLTQTPGFANLKVALLGEQGAADAFGIGPNALGGFSRSGTLAPGRYRFLVDTECNQIASPCSASWDVELFLDHPPGPSVSITGGPSGSVASRSATFEFLVLDSAPPPGRLECALDSGSFTPCTSPSSVSGLVDGGHSFEVRYHPDGGAPGSSVRRTWTVDTTPPVVTFTSGPSGSNNGTTATFAFSASEPATFLCSLDGAPASGCSSPIGLLGLADGDHTFAVQALDTVGNVSDVETARWSVAEICAAAGGPTPAPAPAPGSTCLPPPPTCPPGQSSRAVMGVFNVVARGGPESCFREKTIGGRTVQASAGPVTLNGITFVPAPGTEATLGRELGNVTFRTTGPAKLVLGPVVWPLGSALKIDSELANTTSAAFKLFDGLQSAPGEESLAVGSLPVAVSPTLEFAFKDGGSAKIGIKLKLPTAVFVSHPSLAGSLLGEQAPQGDKTKGLTVEFLLTASNNFGVGFSGKATLGEAWLLGLLKLKDVSLGFDTAAQTFEGSAAVELGSPLPGAKSAELKLDVGLGPGGFFGLLRRLGITGSKLNKPIGTTGFFVQRLGIEARRDAGLVNAVRVTGSAGVSAGPEILGKTALQLLGELELKLPLTGAPWSVEQLGVATIVDVPVAVAILNYTHGQKATLKGNVDLSIAGYGAFAEIKNSWATTEDFNIEASAKLRLPGIAKVVFDGDVDVDAVLSGTGWAVCWGDANERVGFGKPWGQLPHVISGGCDLAPFRSLAKAAQTTGAKTFDVPAGRKLLVVQATGRSTPPKVTLTGPGGQHLQTPLDTSGLTTKTTLLYQDPVRNVTTFVLRHPAAGVYRVTTLPGTENPVSVRQASELPPVDVTAKLRRRGAVRELSWRLRAIPGQKVTFVERGSTGAQVLRATNAATGRLRFKPSLRAGSARRTIQARVVQGKLPRKVLTVARFTESTRLTRVAGIRRSGNALHWRPQAAAASYSVVLAGPAGDVTTHSARGTQLSLPPVLRRAALTVTVYPISAIDRAGRPTTIKLPAIKTKTKTKTKTRPK